MIEPVDRFQYSPTLIRIQFHGTLQIHPGEQSVEQVNIFLRVEGIDQ